MKNVAPEDERVENKLWEKQCASILTFSIQRDGKKKSDGFFACYHYWLGITDEQEQLYIARQSVLRNPEKSTVEIPSAQDFQSIS